MTYTRSLDSMVNFENEVIAPLLRDSNAKVNFPPGYQEHYEKWTAVMGDALINMNETDRLNSFSDYLREENKRFADKAIKRMVTSPAEKKKWRQAAARGQVLRMSTDGDKFNKLIRADQTDKMDGLAGMCLSDTFRSTTTNWQEVCNEQSGLMVAKKLREQHFLVQRLDVGAGLKLEVVHPKTGVYTVEVDLEKPFTEILNFKFRSGDGETKEIAMNKVGEAYGLLEGEFSKTTEVLDRLKSGSMDLMADNLNESVGKFETAKFGAAAMMTAVAAGSQRAARQEEEAAGMMPETMLPGGVMVPNVMAAKSNVLGRMEHQRKVKKDTEEQAGESYEHYKESLKTAREYKDEQREKRKKYQKSDKKRRSVMGAATGIASAGAGLSAGFLTWISM